MTIKIFIDGSCLGNPGKGGIGIAIYKQLCVIHMGFHCNKITTNNRMELSAYIVALSYVIYMKEQNQETSILTDSSYLCTGHKNLKEWKANNWRQKNKNVIANQDLWRKIDELQQYFTDLNVIWIMREINTKADMLAKMSAYNLSFGIVIYEENT